MNKNSFLTFILAIAFLFTLPLKPGLDENQDDGFPYWTLVQTDKGDKKLCFLKMSDKLISLVDGSCAPAEVIKAEISEEIRDLYAVYIEDEVLLCGGATRFFVIEKNNWVKAIDLRDGDHLVSNKDNKPQQVVCKGCQITCVGHLLYRMQIDNPTHCYFVGENAVLVHNYLPAVIFNATVAFGEGAAAGGSSGSYFGPLGISVGVIFGGILGLGIGKWCSDSDHRAREDEYLRDSDKLNFESFQAKYKGASVGAKRCKYDVRLGMVCDLPQEDSSTSWYENPEASSKSKQPKEDLKHQASAATGGPDDPKDPQNRQSQSTTAKPPKDDGNESIESIKRGIRSSEKRIKEHEEKLEKYKKNPDAEDHLGKLKKARNSQERQSIIDTKIKKIETELRTFRNNIEKDKIRLRKRGVEWS